MSTEFNLDEVEFLPLGEEHSSPDNNSALEIDDPVKKDDIDIDAEGGDTDNEDSDLDTDNKDEVITEEEETPDTPNEEDDENESLYKGLIDSVGLELEEDELNELLATEETGEGFTTVASKIADKLSQKKLDAILEKYPQTANLLKYEQNGGNPEEFFDTYFPSVDFNQIEVNDDDVDLQKDLVAESLKLQGFDDEEIAEQVEDYETSGLLDKQAKRSLKLLQNDQANKQKDFEAKQEQLEKDRKAAIEEEKAKVDGFIKEGNIKGIKIPETKSKAFQDYLYKPVTDDGRSQAIVDSQTMDMENRLLIAYLQMNKFDFSALVKAEAKKNSVRTLRDSLKGGDKLKDKAQTTTNSGYSKSGTPDIDTPF